MLFATLSPTGARAEEPADARNWIDRPLLPERWKVEVEAASGWGVRPATDGSAGRGLFAELAVDVGLPAHWQVGLYGRESFGRSGDAGSGELSAFLLNVQHAFAPWGAARADFGFADGTLGNGGLSGGVGLPLKYRFDEHWALTSGRTSPRAFGSASADGDWAGYTPSDDLLTLQMNEFPCLFNNGPGSPSFSPGCGEVWFGTVGLPVGVIFQPFSGLAFGLRSGVRYSFSWGGTPSAFGGGPAGPQIPPLFVPVALEVVASPARWLDLGINAQTAGRPDSLAVNASLSLWTRVRL
jgi:hypothetical protein